MHWRTRAASMPSPVCVHLMLVIDCGCLEKVAAEPLRPADEHLLTRQSACSGISTEFYLWNVQESMPTMRSQSLRGDLSEAQLPSPSPAQRAGQPLGSSSPAGHRSGHLFGSRSPTKGSSAGRLGKSGLPELQRGSDADSLRSFSLRSSSGSVKRSLLASLSASFRSDISPVLPILTISLTWKPAGCGLPLPERYLLDVCFCAVIECHTGSALSTE